MIKKLIFPTCLIMAMVWTTGCCPKQPVAAPPPPVVEPAPYVPAPPPPEVVKPKPIEEPAPSKKLKQRVIRDTD